MQGKVALVTGGARRVGASICRSLHTAGICVMIHCRSSDGEARLLAAELNAIRPGTADVVKGDLLNPLTWERLVEATLLSFGRMDVLVNNASSFYATPLGTISEKDWDDLLGTNLKAPLFLCQAAAGELKKQKGCIVNIADIHAERPFRNHVVYCAAKAGLAALTRSLAQELAPEVRVNGIAPGPILWPESEAWSDPAVRQRSIDQTLLKRVGDPEDIAKAVRYLVVDGGYITGHILVVDGGRSIGP